MVLRRGVIKHCKCHNSGWRRKLISFLVGTVARPFLSQDIPLPSQQEAHLYPRELATRVWSRGRKGDL